MTHLPPTSMLSNGQNLPVPGTRAMGVQLFRSRDLLNELELLLETRRLKRLLSEAEASGRAVSLHLDVIEVERLADFVGEIDGCTVCLSYETGELVLVCPDRETASLARLSL